MMQTNQYQQPPATVVHYVVPQTVPGGTRWKSGPHYLRNGVQVGCFTVDLRLIIILGVSGGVGTLIGLSTARNSWHGSLSYIIGCLLTLVGLSLLVLCVVLDRLAQRKYEKLRQANRNNQLDVTNLPPGNYSPQQPPLPGTYPQLQPPPPGTYPQPPPPGTYPQPHLPGTYPQPPPHGTYPEQKPPLPGTYSQQQPPPPGQPGWTGSYGMNPGTQMPPYSQGSCEDRPPPYSPPINSAPVASSPAASAPVV